MRTFCIFALCVIIGMALVGGEALADETMNLIENTGKIRVGWRANSAPFAFTDPSTGEYTGFSVDMTYLLADKLSEHFGKKIEVESHTVTDETCISMLVNKEIDVEMGFAKATQEHDDVVDFSLAFFFLETTFLVPKDSDIKTITGLDGKRLGVVKGSTNVETIHAKVNEGAFFPGEIVEVEDHAQGLLDLQAGRIDAYCTDRNLLEGLRAKTPNPEDWRIVGFAIAYEPYAYMMREGNSDMRDFINNTIIWSITSGKFYEMYDKWMGTKPVKKLETLSQRLARRARNINIGIMAGTIVFIGLIVFFYGRRLTGNIKYLSEVADKISLGSMDAEIKIKSKDEIGELAKAISRMQESIRLAIERLRRRF